MQGYASLGTLYLLRHPKMNESLLWVVVENNSNDNGIEYAKPILEEKSEHQGIQKVFKPLKK